MTLFLNILFLIIGMILLVVGADIFVDGSSSVARRLKISALIIGLTIVSIGTSLPELSVSFVAALNHKADMSVGNVIGSNIFNTLVVLGMSALLVPIAVKKSMLKFELPLLIVITALVFIVSWLITPKQIGLWVGIILLVLFVGFITLQIVFAKKEQKKQLKQNDDIEEKDTKKEGPLWKAIIFIIGGIAAIWFGGECVTSTASYIAKFFGMSEALVALTIVAVGTSLPELVTSIVAAKKGENDIALGNAVGSNIFNILLILGLSATISGSLGNSLSVSPSVIIDLGFGLFICILIFIFALTSNKVNKIEGGILVSLYIGYVAYLIITQIVFPVNWSF